MLWRFFSEARSIVHAAREKGFCAEAYDLTHGQDLGVDSGQL